VLDFAAATEAERELVVIDVETTGTDPKMADLVEIAAVKVKGNAIVDRWSTFVDPGRPDRRQPDARHHRMTTSAAPRRPLRRRARRSTLPATR
jgi:DNA polymerase III epsilon subunit-like protein